MSIRHLVAAGLSGIVLAILVTVPALAHAELSGSTPTDGAILDTPPTSVELVFSEGIDRDKSSFRLAGPAGDVGTARPAADGATTMRLDGLDLAPGAYAIRWTIGSGDGHVERGTIRFTVSTAPAAPATARPSAVATQAPGVTPGSDDPAAPSATAAPSAGAGDGTAGDGTAGDGGPVAGASALDALVPIGAALALVAVVAGVVLRRGRTR